VLRQPTPEAPRLLTACRNPRFSTARAARHRAEVADALVAGRLSGIIVLQADFAERLGRGEQAPVQVLVDGADPNTAGLVQGYAPGGWQNWLQQGGPAEAGPAHPPGAPPPATHQPR